MKQSIKCLNLDEVRLLLNYLADMKSLEREFFLIDLTLQTGLRVSEVYNLNVGVVKDRKKIEILGKGQKYRVIPLNVDVRRHIEAFLKWKAKHGQSLTQDSPLFISRNNHRWSIRAIQRSFEKIIKEAGINFDYSFHALRHTFATLTYRTGGNIRTVQELLGHSRLDTTMIYTFVSEEDKQKAVEGLATTYKNPITALEHHN